MLFSVELVERIVRNCKRIPHSQFGKGNIVLLLLSQLALIEGSAGKLSKIIIHILNLRLFLGVEPREQGIHRTEVLHDECILDVELVEWEELSEDVFAHLDDVLGLDEGTVLQAANYQQEDVTTHRLHLDPVDVDTSNLEETSYIFKNFNEKKPEFIQRFLYTGFVVH